MLFPHVKEIRAMSEYTMRIPGVGKVSAVSDQAVAQFIIHVQTKSMEETLRIHSEKTATVLSTIRSHGISDRDIKTTLYRYGPTYKDTREDNNTYTRCLDGYDCTQQLCVRVDDLATLPSLIAYLAPNTNLQNVTFGLSEYDELREEAICLAIDDAVDRAHIRAEQLNVSVEQVVEYEEPVDYDQQVRTRGGVQAQFASSAPEGTPQLPTGENEISVTVMVTFRIR